jgi:membrane-associated phospholipid phosphatase
MATHKMKAALAPDYSTHKAASSGLQSTGLLGRHPVIGVVMFVFGGLIFSAMTYNMLVQGPLLGWDNTLATVLPAAGLKSPPMIKIIMDAGFYIGKEVVVALDILLGLYFLVKKYWQELVMIIIGVSGSGTLFSVLSNYFNRPRPPTQIWIIVNLPGYPSGHAVTVVVFYGLLAYLLVPKMPSTFWKAIVTAAALLIIAFVGFSRLFTGGHYLTDILAGYGLGIAWSGLVYTLVELVFKKRGGQNVKKESIRAR